MAYLERVKGGAHGSGGLERSPREAEAFSVNECLNVDVMEEKISKTVKNAITKNHGQMKGRQAQGPTNTPLLRLLLG